MPLPINEAVITRLTQAFDADLGATLGRTLFPNEPEMAALYDRISTGIREFADAGRLQEENSTEGTYRGVISGLLTGTTGMNRPPELEAGFPAILERAKQTRKADRGWRTLMDKKAFATRKLKTYEQDYGLASEADHAVYTLRLRNLEAEEEAFTDLHIALALNEHAQALLEPYRDGAHMPQNRSEEIDLHRRYADHLREKAQTVVDEARALEAAHFKAVRTTLDSEEVTMLLTIGRALNMLQKIGIEGHAMLTAEVRTALEACDFSGAERIITEALKEAEQEPEHDDEE